MLIGGEQRRRLSPSPPFTPCPSRVRVSRPTVSDRVAALSSDFALPVRSIRIKMPPGLRRGCAGKIAREVNF
jgi:hypothetical protein